MWATLLPIVAKDHAGRKRLSKRTSEVASSPPLVTAAELEFFGTCLPLVTRLIREDARKPGSALVSIQDRPAAAGMLTVLLTDPSERHAYEQFLRLAMPELRYSQLPEAETSRFLIERRWPQLASGLFAQLLLNPTALASLSARIESERPAAWADLLPPPKAVRRMARSTHRKQDKKT
jgi:hypothetical protein